MPFLCVDLPVETQDMLEHVVVGGGIVGLAVGAVLSRFGSTAVLERHKDLLHETSSRNSGVVHAGLYYPADSLKARLCIDGNENTWRLAEKFSLRSRRCGKYVGSVTVEEDAEVEKIAAKMRLLNRPFCMVSAKELAAVEPLVAMRTVLLSKSTGIVDVCALRDFFVSQIRNSQYDSFVMNHVHVHRIELHRDKCRVFAGDADSEPVEAANIVLSAGLSHNQLWQNIFRCDESNSGDDGGGNTSTEKVTIGHALPIPPPAHHALHFCRGSYVGYRKKIVQSLVYPCPLPNLKGLGFHTTIDLDGPVKFGPDAEYVSDSWDLAITEARGAAIVETAFDAVRKYIPSIDKSLMFPDFSGMRPKLSGEGETARDFVIERCESRLIALVGIESPGLTAATAIADQVAGLAYGPDALLKSPSPWAR